jgi:hypothetical protein
VGTAKAVLPSSAESAMKVERDRMFSKCSILAFGRHELSARVGLGGSAWGVYMQMPIVTSESPVIPPRSWCNCLYIGHSILRAR